MIRESLHNYIFLEVVPKYAAFDKAHREDHALMVIDRALAMGKQYDIDEEMLLTAAACHDLGLSVDRKTHHLESGRIIRGMVGLQQWFSADEIELIAKAAEDHRASSDHAPRSIYGRIVAEADREGHWQRTLEHLHEKYYYGGYLQLWIPESPNSTQLVTLRQIIADEAGLRIIFDRIFTEETLEVA